MTTVTAIDRRRQAKSDRPGVVLLRNSTPAQVNNARSLKAERVARKLLEDRGIRVGKVIDEQGTSGKSLKDRPDAQQLVDEVDRGEWAAVAVIETSRASRDPDLIDQHIFMKACKRGKALLITPSKEYDFRNSSDRLQYNVQAIIDAEEWVRTRKRTFEGVVERFHQQPAMFGFAPFGYRPGKGTVVIRGKKRKVRIPEKDPAQAKLMEAIGRALDEERTLSRACRRLNAEGYRQPPGPRTRPDQPDGGRWYWSQLQKVFETDRYWGTWTFGVVHTDDADDLWEENEIAGAPPTHYREDLAWYTQERVEKWRSMFIGKGPVKVRIQKWSHTLIGILRCAYCHEPMISQGNRGYTCRLRRDGRCRGQNLSCPQADKAARQLLEDVLPEVAHVAKHVEAALERRSKPRDLNGELRGMDREISARWEMNAQANARGLATPDDFWDKLQVLQTERDQLAAELADADRINAERRRLLAIAGRFTDVQQVLNLYDTKMRPEDQQALLATLFNWVEMSANGGRGNRAKAWVTNSDPTFVKSVMQLDPRISFLNRLDEAVPASVFAG
jgi:DNA invertase Pin-like site-specific DNA recombinase